MESEAAEKAPPTPQHTIAYKPSAAKAFKHIHKDNQVRIKDAIEDLASNPRPLGAILLVGGGGARRIRVGDYRVIYEIADTELIVLVIKIGHRRDIYN